MTGLLKPKAPTPPEPVKPPDPPAAADAATAGATEAERLRKRRGTASTVLAGDTATVAPGSVATKTLLGQ
ncbi:hypothetical protein [Achromobacter spanius]|uniref:hypothetical protein n=1 Tax=Achromobacter spanius TaxID=217203 RepID=UPI0009FB5596|nr:hypothetical protein [Achromobacter spanius]